jgi:UDP-GlcNAc:undecaprenyl-phosphate GlcNAc-1-phosphate transferase
LRDLFLTILSTLAISVVITPLAKRLAVWLGAVDRPGGRRRVHVREVPRLGGVAVFFPVMAAVGVVFWTMHGEEARVDPHQFLGLAVACGAIFLLGLYDDIRGANAPTKFGVQLLAASVVYFSGLQVSTISTPFGWSMELGIFAFPITLLWLVGLSNAMNLLDGLDGLAAGVSAMAALTIMVLAVGMGSNQVALIAAGLFGALLGFLPYNFNPASIFLGDCGALFLGFFLAALPIMSSQKAATAVALLLPILSLGIPIFDTSLAFFRRLAEGKHPFQADRRHLHHRLLDRGFNQRKVVLTLYAVSAFLSAMAMFMANASRIGAFLALVAVGMGGVVAVRRLGLEEFQELARKFRYGERRRRPPRAKAMLVRNSVPILKRMTSRQALEVLLEDIRRNLGFNELVLSIKPEYCPPLLNGAAEIRMTGSILAEGLTGNGSHETEPWTATVEILPPEDARGQRSEVRGQSHRATEPQRSEVSRQLSEVRGQSNRTAEPQQGSGAGEQGSSSGSEGGTFNVERLTSLGTVTATKPAWMRRRQSDSDLELLTWLADGVGAWLAGLSGTQ